MRSPATSGSISARAIRDGIPLFVPAIPFALVLGVAMADSAMPTWVAWLTNPLVFAGAAQLATVSLAATSSWATLVATAAVINLRHVMYSAALSGRFSEQPSWFRRIGPYFLIDQLFALASVRHELDDGQWRRYYLTTGLFFLVSWHISVTVGVLVGSGIPTEWRLGTAPAVMFAGLVVIGLTNRPGAIAAVTAAIVAFAALDVPNNGGLLIGALAGVAAGAAADRAQDRPRSKSTEPGRERP